MKENITDSKKENKVIDLVKLEVDNKELASLIGNVCSETYGVVGLTRVKTIKNQLVILRKQNYVEGILIFKNSKGRYDIDVHLICAYGVKISEVVNEVSKRIAYETKKKYGPRFNKINVYIEDLLDL
ncbi:MAG: Asp23/Gls24 family envelope stress response protein [Erysipelotrichaceae bacterium]|jgi:uncharacterized alkaline shock family protein YloU|nr:Asp23/Gls24 family envelope stress response protein [Erysipelotrichaceae bacterium]MCB9500047.1 Asp23/Gls24 family envelope stress response protein [Erysipelotrichaceae bacterium]